MSGPAGRRERAGSGPAGPAGRHPGSRSTMGEITEPGVPLGPTGLVQRPYPPLPEFSGPGAGFHCWRGASPHCTRCQLLYEVWVRVDGPARCPQTTVVEELAAVYGPPDLDRQGADHTTGMAHRSLYWNRSKTRPRMWLSVQWTRTGGCWEVLAGRDPTKHAEGRQVEFSYGTSEAQRPPQALLRTACVLCGLLDA